MSSRRLPAIAPSASVSIRESLARLDAMPRCDLTATSDMYDEFGAPEVARYQELVPGRYIRDNHVRDMAKRLAALLRTTMTDAVRRAIERELADVEQDLRSRSGSSTPRWLGWMPCPGTT